MTSSESPRIDAFFGIDWAAAPGGAARDPERAIDAERWQDEGRRATEPPCVWEKPEAYDGEYDADAALADLRAFFTAGRRAPHAVEAPDAPRPTPAALYAFLDPAARRAEFPVCVFRDRAPRSLAAVVDELVAGCGDDDAGRRVAAGLRRLEAALCAEALPEPGEAASEVLARVGEEGADADARAMLAEALEGATLVGLADGVAARLVDAAVRVAHAEHVARWRDDLAALVRRAEDLVAADDAHRRDALEPDHLRHAAGDENEVDFEAMARILAESGAEGGLGEARRRRITDALAVVRRMQPVFEGKDGPFDRRVVVDHVESARAEAQRRLETVAAFARAVRILELEVDHRWDDDAHDRYFATFGVDDLDPAERELCPPVVLHVTPAFDLEAGAHALLDLAHDALPVQIVVEIDDLVACDGDLARAEATPRWVVGLARMVAASGHAFVFQSPVARADRLAEAAARGAVAARPALYAVYTGRELPGRDRLLDAAAAGESRAFPVFCYDPTRGETLADCLDVSDNPRPEQTWLESEFAYVDAEGEPATRPVGLTPAGFFSQDPRFQHDYWTVPPSRWHRRMAPLVAWLREPDDETIPYLTVVDAEGVVGRVVFSRRVLAMVERFARTWRRLAEEGGAGTSWTERALETARIEHAQALAAAVAETEARCTADLDRELGELSRVIVERIADRLLGGTGPLVSAGGTGAAATAPAAPAAPAAAGAQAPAAQPAGAEAEASGDAAAEAPAEADDEDLALDDPYIDTPLCTSCNECTGINARIFAYNDNKQAYIADPDGGPYADLVAAAEKCPVHIIHPGKPRNPDEPNLDALVERAKPYL